MRAPGAGQLLAAPDKFRGTASAQELAAAAVHAAERSGWRGDARPLADGGDGLLDALGGERRSSEVTGPLGGALWAEWSLLDDGEVPTAVVEMAQASGILAARGPAWNDPLAATTAGTGELILAAVEAGARRVVVGCGGSATTDGGSGALAAIGDPARLAGVELVVACDVTTTFVEAAAVFGPQKGATPEQVVELTRRLEALVGDYRRRYGVDVAALPGGGAAGGLAGGLVAIGGHIVSGFDLVADLVHLDAAIADADLVVTGEGRLDTTSLEGKLVTSLLRRVAGRVPTLVVAGSAPDVRAAQLAEAAGVGADGVEIVSLAERFGLEAALARPAELLGEAVSERIGGRR